MKQFAPQNDLLPVRPNHVGALIHDESAESDTFKVLLPPNPTGLSYVFLHTRPDCKTVVYAVQKESIVFPPHGEVTSIYLTTPGSVLRVTGVGDKWYAHSTIDVDVEI